MINMNEIRKDYEMGREMTFEEATLLYGLESIDIIEVLEGVLIDSYIYYSNEKYILILERYKNPWASVHYVFETSNEKWVYEYIENEYLENGLDIE